MRVRPCSIPTLVILWVFSAATLGLPPALHADEPDVAAKVAEMRQLLAGASPEDLARLTDLSEFAYDSVPELRRELVLALQPPGPDETGREFVWTLWKSRLMLATRVGFGIQLEFLLKGRGGAEFLDRIRANFSGYARDLAQAPAGPWIVARLERHPDPQAFLELFPIICGHHPRVATGVAIARLDDPGLPASVVIETLQAYWSQPWSTATEWKSWWSENTDVALFPRLLAAERRRAVDRARRMWRLANDHVDPTRVHSWLQTSLAEDQVDAVRVEILGAIEAFAFARFEESADADAVRQRRGLLQPLFEGSLAIAADPKETRSVRRAALKAVGVMGDFKEDSTLQAFLARLIAELPNSRAGKFEYEFARQAVRITGALRAPLGAALHRALSQLIPADSHGDWSQVDAVLVGEVLLAFKYVGPTDDVAINTLRRIFEEAPATWTGPRDAVLAVIRGNSRPEVLDLYLRILIDGPTTYQEDALRGIDLLRATMAQDSAWAERATGALLDFLGRLEVDVQLRKQAIEKLVNFGSNRVATALRQSMEGGMDPALKSHVLTAAVAMCAADLSRARLANFVLTDTDEPTPWFLEFVATPSIATLLALSPGQWDFADETGPDDTEFGRWRVLQDAYLKALSDAAAAPAIDLATERVLHTTLAERAEAWVAAVTGSAPDFAPEEVMAVARISRQKVTVLRHLADGEWGPCAASFDELLSGVSERNETTFGWLLRRLDGEKPRPGERAFLEKIREAATRLDGVELTAATRALLDALEKRQPETPIPGPGQTPNVRGR